MKKKLLKKALIVLVVTLIAISLYNVICFFRSGKQSMEVSVNGKYYTEENIEAIVSLKDSKTDISKDGKLKVELLNSEGKKVKGIKEKYDIEEGKDTTISLPVNDKVDTGNYSLKLTATDGLLKDEMEVDVSIVKGTKDNVVISLDKGIYKPGDTVSYRAMLLSKKDDTPVSKEVTVSIYDGNENRVYIEKAKTSEFGIVSGKFKLADEVNSGEYKIIVATNSIEQTKIFNVNPYVTPTFEATITTDKDIYLVGEIAQVTLNAKYFFGEPVKNATVEGKINEDEIKGITDENGNFNTTYEIKEVGKANIDLQVTDTSNYLIEAQKTILGSSDVFEIELLPENGDLIKGINNTIYIFTKKADGTPVKTHTTVQFGQKSKQVITDKNGIGKFVLTSEDINLLETRNYNNYDYDYNDYYSSYSKDTYQTSVFVMSKDMNENLVSKDCEFTVKSNSGIVMQTDKVKYTQGEDIKLTLSSASDITNAKIYVYKNDQLLKMISTDKEEVEFNLEDSYGLIDIFIENNDEHVMPMNSFSYYDIYRDSSYTQKTIFIKPEKGLAINIETDAEEYKPGDDLNIKFTTKNESNESVESALLVSILDEAILELAENDLSIDNIKLALEDIKFVDGITAADIYANIADDKDEQLLMGLLLKQDSGEANAKTYYNNGSVSKAVSDFIKGLIPGGIGLLIFIAYASINSKKFRNGMTHGVVVLALFLITSYCLSEIIDELFAFIVGFVVTIAIYIAILYKYRDYIFKMLLDLAIIPGILFSLVYIAYEEIFDYNDFVLYFSLLLPLIIWSILEVISRKGKLAKLPEKVKKACAYLIKIEIMYFIIGLICTIIDPYETFAILIIAILVYILFNKVLNRNQKTKKENIKIEINGTEVTGIVVVIIAIILLGMIVFSTIGQFSSNISSVAPSINNSYLDDSFSKGDSIGIQVTPNSFDGAADSASSITNGYNDILEGATDFLNSGSKNDYIENTMESLQEETEHQLNVETEKEESVRNVFLESLAFIPELVTNQGMAETNIKISDNITTWNIQTIGNTKEGNVGFATSSFKVFKEFFIDFTLPTNSVVTDKISIPVTVYNYKDTDLTVQLEVKENDWCTIGEYTKQVTIKPENTTMIYVPIEILASGNQTLRIEAKSNDNIQDIVEKTLEITPNGLEKTNVVSSGVIEENYTQDFFTTEEAIENTRKLKVKIYPSTMAQVMEGMENIFRMPTGCFEQTSSSLYPNILALKYLEDNDLSNNEIKEKALEYISAGYQKILSYEVPGEKGGYSLYGKSPAEPVLTAFGLMEISDLSEVYDVEDKVIENMTEYLFKEQKLDGSFDYRSTYIGSAASTDDLAMNAYIIWALSEVCPEDDRLEESVEYLENNLSKVEDNYTRALIANVFSNVNHSLTDEIIEDLMEQIQTEGETAYISSKIRDYYGSYGRYQNVQTTALTSMVLTKENVNRKTNQSLINYIIESKDSYGTWGTTQATILALKAINAVNTGTDLSNQVVSVKVNDEVKDIEIGEEALDYYELEFNNISKEAKISIDMKKGKLSYEIVEEYYVPYSNIEPKKDIEISQQINSVAKVNDIIVQNIQVANLSEETIRNGLVQINIPQGCSTIEESLMQLEYSGIIEKYEYSYGKINLYIRNFDAGEFKDIEVQYRAQYPANITGASIRCYDYYNPDIEGILLPTNINIAE